jgi:hypothetical protein
MLHEDPDAGWGTRSPGRVGNTKPVSVLAYRSRPVSQPSITDLEHLLRAAQQRNRVEGVTGILIYDQGCFFQWLEGPKPGLMRVWDSIRRDPRHVDLKILRHESLPKRLFNHWDMRFARRTRGEIDRTFTVMNAPHELLSKLRQHPSVLVDSGWDSVFSTAVVPQLIDALVHPQPEFGDSGDGAVQRIWHAPRSAAADLAGLLQHFDPLDSSHFVDALIEQGAGLEPLFREVFEPAARRLGGLWEDDLCDDFGVAAALGRLQVEARRLSAVLCDDTVARHPGHAVLVVSQPGEMHGLGRTMGSELFLRDGWDVICEIPRNNNVLLELVHETWFDVLDLSVSTALRRDQQLATIRATIDATRSASRNPRLAIIVDGRSFFEQPAAYQIVGADMGCRTAAELVPSALRWLDAHPSTPLGCAAVPASCQ